MAEMISGVPLFRGRDNNDQLNQILRILGTPDEATLRRIIQESPEITLKQQFPRLNPVPLTTILPRADTLAIDLLEKLLRFDPSQRLSAADALQHAYFTGPATTMPIGNSAANQAAYAEQNKQVRRFSFHSLYVHGRSLRALQQSLRAAQQTLLQQQSEAEYAAAAQAQAMQQQRYQQQQQPQLVQLSQSASMHY